MQRQQRCPRSGGETPGTRVSITRALILSEPARGVYHCEWEGARALRRTVPAGQATFPWIPLKISPTQPPDGVRGGPHTLTAQGAA